MKTLLALVAAAMALAGCSTNQQGVSQNELHAPVLATLEANSKGGKVHSIIKVTDTTHTEYRADVTTGDISRLIKTILF